jgi:6-pyruvoyltetrahydropterin/6-carboxytetrahydropterin synthase
MFKLEYKAAVACAHHLEDTKSLATKKCLRLHGHNYNVLAIIETSELKDGMVIDFGKLKEIIDVYDHQCLNDYLDNPTTESFAQLLHSDIINAMNDEREIKVEVIISESDKGSISYK